MEYLPSENPFGIKCNFISCNKGLLWDSPNKCDIEVICIFGYHRILCMRYQHLQQFPSMHFTFNTTMIKFQQLNSSQNQFSKGEKTFCIHVGLLHFEQGCKTTFASRPIGTGILW